MHEPLALVAGLALTSSLLLVGAPADAAGSKYTFKVTGSGTATSITMLTDGDITQVTSHKLPYTKKVTGKANIYGLSAQAGPGTKSITCEIRNPRGKVVKKKTSRGQYAVVNCTYTHF